MNVWVYRSRNGNHGVFAAHEFAAARERQDYDNRVTLEELLEVDPDAVSGCEDDGYFAVDDGGSIQLFPVEGMI